MQTKKQYAVFWADGAFRTVRLSDTAATVAANAQSAGFLFFRHKSCTSGKARREIDGFCATKQPCKVEWQEDGVEWKRLEAME